MVSDQNTHVRDYLANERTYLAYLRTSLSLLSLGISVNRFSLFLLEKDKIAKTTAVGQTLVSAETLGFGMVVVGLILLVWGTLHFTLTYKQIGSQTYRPNIASTWVLSTLIFGAAILAATLLFAR